MSIAHSRISCGLFPASLALMSSSSCSVKRGACEVEGSAGMGGCRLWATLRCRLKTIEEGEGPECGVERSESTLDTEIETTEVV